MWPFRGSNVALNDMSIILLRHIGTQHAARFMIEAVYLHLNSLLTTYGTVWYGTVRYGRMYGIQTAPVY